MAKKASRPQQWQASVARCRGLRQQVIDKADELAEALTELYDIQQEYQEWRDNLPESMENSATAEKLDAVLELSLDNSGCGDDVLNDWDSISSAIDEAEAVDLPLGFGRD